MYSWPNQWMTQPENTTDSFYTLSRSFYFVILYSHIQLLKQLDSFKHDESTLHPLIIHSVPILPNYQDCFCHSSSLHMSSCSIYFFCIYEHQFVQNTSTTWTINIDRYHTFWIWITSDEFTDLLPDNKNASIDMTNAQVISIYWKSRRDF